MGATVEVVLSGVLTTLVNWRWNFLLNLPLALVALLLLPLLMKGERGLQKGQRRIDLLGTSLITGGLVAVQASLGKWTTPPGTKGISPLAGH